MKCRNCVLFYFIIAILIISISIIVCKPVINNNVCVPPKNLAKRESGMVEFKQTMLSQSKTTYDILFDYDLKGRHIIVPEECVLHFKGGSFRNGVLEGKNTKIVNSTCDIIFHEKLELCGTWGNTEAYPEWFGAKGDGESDDTESISKTIRYFSNIRFRPNTTYVTNTIGIGSNKNINGGYNSTLKCVGEDGIHYIFDIQSSHNISIRGVSFDGNTHTINTEPRYCSGAYYCIKIGTQKAEIQCPHNIIIENCCFTGSYNSAVSNLKTEILGADSIVIRECKFYDVGWHGVGMNYWRNSIVSNCKFSRVGLHPIHKDGCGGGLGVDVSAGCENIIVYNNIVLDSPGGFKAETHDNDTHTSAKHVFFSNNIVEGRRDPQYSVYYGFRINGGDVICTNNTVSDVVGTGILLGINSRRCIVTSNVVRNTGLFYCGKQGIRIDGFGSNLVIDNHVSNTNGSIGIEVNSADNIIKRNKIEDATYGIGVFSADNIVKNNVITHCIHGVCDFDKTNVNGNVIEKNDTRSEGITRNPEILFKSISTKAMGFLKRVVKHF